MNLSIQETFHSYVGPMELNLTLKKGECMGLLGPNGAGKSTILHFLKLNQKRLFPEHGAAFLDQGRLSCLSHLRGIDLLKLLEKNFPERIRYSIQASPLEKIFPLGEKLLRPLSALSGGEFQQVKLQALFNLQAHTYFLDEPFTHLDQSKQEVLLKYLEEQKKAGFSIVIIHHSWGMLWPILDTVAHVPLRNGQLVQVRGIPKAQFQGAP